jgi:hypothetical protein
MEDAFKHDSGPGTKTLAAICAAIQKVCMKPRKSGITQTHEMSTQTATWLYSRVSEAHKGILHGQEYTPASLISGWVYC